MNCERRNTYEQDGRAEALQLKTEVSARDAVTKFQNDELQDARAREV